MSQHLHAQHVEGCFRCDLSRSEAETDAVIDEMNELVDRLEGSALKFARLRHGYTLVRE